MDKDDIKLISVMFALIISVSAVVIKISNRWERNVCKSLKEQNIKATLIDGGLTEKCIVLERQIKVIQ